MKKVSMYLLGVVAVVALALNLSSCGGSSEEPVKAPSDFTYPATSVQVGATGSVMPSGTDSGLTYDFANKSAVPAFISLNPSTGEIEIGEESTTGEYSVEIRASNSAGSAKGTADIKIIVADDFNPVGKKLLPKYFINQEEGLTLVGLTGIPDLPVDTLQIPVGWPPSDVSGMDSLAYVVLTGIGRMLWEVPLDRVCDDYDISDYLVNDDFTLSAMCSGGADPSDNAGTWLISYKDGGYIFTMNLKYDDAIAAIAYPVGSATFEDFQDPLEGRTYPSLHGVVEAFTMPSDYSTEDAMKNPATWIHPKVEVVLEVVTE